MNKVKTVVILQESARKKSVIVRMICFAFTQTFTPNIFDVVRLIHLFDKA